jgi:UDP-N-acetyl-D-glucosamine dehydrogenase
MDLKSRIESKQATAAIIGLGYVGLPLAVELARAGIKTIGFDVDVRKVNELKAGRSYIPDVSTEHVADVIRKGTLIPTTDAELLKTADIIDICVPTPLRKTKDPDMSYIVKAVETTAKALHGDMLVILESTTYPGTTDELVQPALEATGLKAGRDFYLAFSPERVDPGNPTYQTKNIPKVVGGFDEKSTEIAATFYRQVVDTVVPVSSTRAAEMVKLLENTFRAVNIGMANELALMCHRMSINVWEVIEAAKTKPFGFMPFYPGPGLGGHCIPIDPFYLSWKAKQFNFEARFIELAGQVNSAMPEHVVSRVADALNTQKKALNGSRVHVLGIAYKRDIDDVRESPALDVIELLGRRGAIVTYSDPYVPEVDHGHHQLREVPIADALKAGADCAVVVTDHKVFDYGKIVEAYPLIVDTRNALKSIKSAKIFGL